jgi:hypothetical protein
MPRSVKEWAGKNDDTPVPARVRLRVFERCLGRCHKCLRPIGPAEKWTCEHLTAIINGGVNAEPNLRLTCCNCLPAKNAADVAEKAKVARSRKKHLGITKSKRPLSAPNPKAWKYDWQAGRYVKIA